MSLETAQFIHQLNPQNPSGADRLRDGDDHIRMLKAALKATFPNVKGEVSLSHTKLNDLVNYLVPIGTICLHAGVSAPAGWVICDGQTYARSDGAGQITTPDLRDRVAVGSSPTYPTGAQFGAFSKTVNTAEGGAHTHSGVAASAGAHKHNVAVQDHVLTVDQIPSHKHANGVGDGSQVAFNHGATTATPTSTASMETHDAVGNLEGWTSTTGGGQAHKHGVTEADAGAHTHALTIDAAAAHQHAVNINVAQPSYALNYIMKI